MSETIIIALVASISAIIGALIAGAITYMTTSKRNRFEAIIEICKYREKWLEQARQEMVEFNTYAVLARKINFIGI